MCVCYSCSGHLACCCGNWWHVGRRRTLTWTPSTSPCSFCRGGGCCNPSSALMLCTSACLYSTASCKFRYKLFLRANRKSERKPKCFECKKDPFESGMCNWKVTLSIFEWLPGTLKEQPSLRKVLAKQSLSFVNCLSTGYFLLIVAFVQASLFIHPQCPLADWKLKLNMHVFILRFAISAWLVVCSVGEVCLQLHHLRK